MGFTPLVGLLLLLPGADPVLSPRELSPGVFALRASDRHGSANVGWAALGDHAVLIGVPYADLVGRCLAEAARTTGKPVREAILLQLRPGEAAAARALAAADVTIHATREGAKLLRAALAEPPAAGLSAGERIREFEDRLELTAGETRLLALDLGHAAGPGDAAVLVQSGGVLFTGEACVNGPRAALTGSDTRRWALALESLERLPVRSVVPGFGSIGGPEVLGRQRRFLLELRRQVGYLVAQGRPIAAIRREVQIEPEWLVWMPYDHPSSDDIDHVHRELTVPEAPFRGQPFLAGEARPRALALIGDRFHEPGHLEAGLSRALEKAGIPVRFAVDVRALSAATLKEVDLLVILRDGMLWPDPDRPYVVWMTPEQEQAVAAFVEGGGGLLALHNSPGLYPEGGPYLRLLGATFKGHGPLEEFRVRVLDPHHPITRGVSDYEIADEQHTPVPDLEKVHLLLESRSEEGVVGAAGWAYESKKGRVAYLANGHTRDALVHPQYQLLLQNAARWCLRRDATGG